MHRGLSQRPWQQRILSCLLLSACILLFWLFWPRTIKAGNRARLGPAQQPSLATLRRMRHTSDRWRNNGPNFPIIQQATRFTCGTACLMSALQTFTGYNGTEAHLMELLGSTPRDGTHPDRIVKVARQFGLKAELREGLTVKEVRKAAKEGHAVILDLQAWRSEKQKRKPWSKTWNEGHYVLLNSLGTKYGYFMDPAAGPAFTWMPLRELVPRWHDWEQDKKGQRREYHQAAIIIYRPEGPLPEFPDLIRMK